MDRALTYVVAAQIRSGKSSPFLPEPRVYSAPSFAARGRADLRSGAAAAAFSERMDHDGHALPAPNCRVPAQGWLLPHQGRQAGHQEDQRRRSSPRTGLWKGEDQAVSPRRIIWVLL